MMWTLLNYRIWLALALSLALSGLLWKAYKIGGDQVTRAWDADKLEQARDLAKFSEAARSKEQEIQANTRKVTNDYIAQKKLHAAAAARSADSLRDLQAELATPAQSCGDPATPSRTNATVGLERELLGQCAKALTELAADADRLEAQVVGLQGYVVAIGVAK
jgi:hypothetical protein